jgi:hypothetical protein
MSLISKTINIRSDQVQRLLNVAARRQLETGKSISVSDVARDVIDVGLASLQSSKPRKIEYIYKEDGTPDFGAMLEKLMGPEWIAEFDRGLKAPTPQEQ